MLCYAMLCYAMLRYATLRYAMRHDDRLVLGVSQVFRVFDPRVAEKAKQATGGGPPRIIDWDLAQQELLSIA